MLHFYFASQASLAMRHIVKLAGGTDKPHILCGDFNQEPHMPGYQLMENGYLSDDNKGRLRKNITLNNNRNEVCAMFV